MPDFSEADHGQSISVEVVPYGDGRDGPYQAGMAVVTLNGEVIAQLRTSEGIEFVIASPIVSTRKAVS